MSVELHSCQLCPRLTDYRLEQKIKFPEYHCLPVPGFGSEQARLLIVGLAPGLHGANASGRPFTGDASGDLLFKTLFRFKFADRPESKVGDAVALIDCRVTNAVKCLPPDNKPRQDEITQCNPYLLEEINALQGSGIILALGVLAHRAVLKALKLQQSKFAFSHCAEHQLPGNLRLIDSYHCSRYNINTRRLTEAMFDRVFEIIRQYLK